MFLRIALLGAVCALCSSVWAVDLQWSGRYRVEGNFIKNPTMSAGDQNYEKSYILHHLILEPKIIPQDGITIKSRFDIFNNAAGNNQAGQVFGDYAGGPATDQQPAVTTRNLDNESLQVSELYAIWANEFGGMIVGRVPFQFGLGMTHSAGEGMFDHWLDTKDAIMYKIVIGNMSITPGYAKVRESDLVLEDDVNEYVIDVSYDDPERDLKMGFIFDHRNAPLGSNPYSSTATGNDIPIVAPAGTVGASYTAGSSNIPAWGTPCAAGDKLTGTGFVGDCGSTKPDGYGVYLMNFYVQRKTATWNIGAEAGFQNGYTGVKTSTGERVEWAGWGLATEMGYKPSNVGLSLKAGIASGDDPDTARIESYFFSKNYNIAMLMFNHVLGGFDVVGSALAGSRGYTANAGSALKGVTGIDSEVITNAIYAAPTLTVSVGDRWDWLATLAYAVQQKPTAPSARGSMGQNLGFETDFGFRYHPTDRFTIATDLGMFFPGNAWAGTGNAPYKGKNEPVYGLTTKAAVNF